MPSPARPPANLPAHRRAGPGHWTCALLGAAHVAALASAHPAPDDAPRRDRDKSQYHLLNPTPRELMRELAADRPDRTESPVTVDAGHVQLELDLVQYGHDRERTGSGEIRTETWRVAPMNLKLGVLNNLDVQLILGPYSHTRERNRSTGQTETRSGFEGLATRVKLNLFGNDEGAAALAVMPVVRWPTASADLGSDHVEGGLIVPFATELPGGWSLGVMTEVGWVRDERDARYDTLFVNSLVLGRPITDRLGGYVEFFSAVSTGAEDWVGTIDTGLTFAVNADLQLDAGVNIGVTRAAEDVNPFLGLTARY